MNTGHHIVAVSPASPGHVGPLLRFCKILATRHGLEITVINLTRPPAGQSPKDSPDSAVGVVAEQHGSGIVRQVNVPIDFDDRSTTSEGFQISLAAITAAMSRTVRRCLVDVIEKSRQGENDHNRPVTCILCDLLFSSCTQEVAEQFGLPRIALYTACQSFFLLTLYMTNGKIPPGDAMRILKEKDPSCNRRLAAAASFPWLTGLDGLPDLSTDDLPHYRHVQDETDHVHAMVIGECEAAIAGGLHAIAVNSWEALEGPAFQAMRRIVGENIPILPVGPLAGSGAGSFWKEDVSCLDWLDRQPEKSVLYIAFGSMAALGKDQLAELMEGILASKQRFLWAFRPDLVSPADNSDSDSDIMSPDAISSRSEGRGCIVSWAPQIAVLSHPSVAGFLTHCGWNSTTEALAAGVPMLCWPYFADQTLNAKLVADVWKIGIRFCKGELSGLVTKQEVERAVRLIMGEDSGAMFRQVAAQIKDACQLSICPGGSSYDNISRIVESLPRD